MAAYLDLAEAAGAEIVTPLAAWANPSGPVDGKAYDRFCDLIAEAVAKGCDAIFLDLHGAMVVADRTDDGEGTLLQKLRRIAPRTPIAVSLDLHANVTDEMVRNCDVIAGYKTYPHVDGYEAGQLAGSILLRYLKGEVKPVMAWGNVPLLAQTLRQNTDESPMKDCVDAARAAEKNGLLAATAFWLCLGIASAQPKSMQQLLAEHIDLRFGMFIHFNMNTFFPGWAEPRTDFPPALFVSALIPRETNISMICRCAAMASGAPLPPLPVFCTAR
jgi:hypothetical protein